MNFDLKCKLFTCSQKPDLSFHYQKHNEFMLRKYKL